MDPDIRTLLGIVHQLVKKVDILVDKVDGLVCHFTSIDGDYTRLRAALQNHEDRLARIEREHNFEPAQKVGENSALFPAVKNPSEARTPVPPVSEIA